MAESKTKSIKTPFSDAVAPQWGGASRKSGSDKAAAPKNQPEFYQKKESK